MSSQIKKRIYLAAKIAFTLVLLFYVIKFVKYEEILRAFSESNKVFISLVFLLMFLNIYFQFLKWRVVCKSLLKTHDNAKIWKSLFYGFSAGIITPVRMGEYIGRKLALNDISLLKVTISTILEKFASLFIVLLFGGVISILFIWQHYSPLYSIPIFLLLIGLGIVSAIVSKRYNLSSKTLNKYASKYQFLKNLKLELHYLKEIDKSTAASLFQYSFLFYLIVILQYALLAKAFYQDGNILIYLAAGSMILFVKSILSFLSFADLGIRETTSVFLLNKVGYSAAVGFNSAIFLFFFNLLLPSIAGMFLMLKRDKKAEK